MSIVPCSVVGCPASCFALPEIRVTKAALAFAFERPLRVQSKEPSAACVTTSSYSFGSSGAEPGPQVQLLAVQLVGSLAVTDATAPRVNAVPRLMDTEKATVALCHGSAPIKSGEETCAESALDWDDCACCGPTATPALSGNAALAWSLKATPPPQAAARAHERASSLRIGLLLVMRAVWLPASMPWTQTARPKGNRDRSPSDSAGFRPRTPAHVGALRSTRLAVRALSARHGMSVLRDRTRGTRCVGGAPRRASSGLPRREAGVQGARPVRAARARAGPARAAAPADEAAALSRRHLHRGEHEDIAERAASARTRRPAAQGRRAARLLLAAEEVRV